MTEKEARAFTGWLTLTGKRVTTASRYTSAVKQILAQTGGVTDAATIEQAIRQQIEVSISVASLWDASWRAYVKFNEAITASPVECAPPESEELYARALEIAKTAQSVQRKPPINLTTPQEESDPVFPKSVAWAISRLRYFYTRRKGPGTSFLPRPPAFAKVVLTLRWGGTADARIKIIPNPIASDRPPYVELPTFDERGGGFSRMSMPQSIAQPPLEILLLWGGWTAEEQENLRPPVVVSKPREPGFDLRQFDRFCTKRFFHFAAEDSTAPAIDFTPALPLTVVR
jgi:hypothetical protein